MSVPLLTPRVDPRAPESPCLGVVNVQRSEPGILRGDGHDLFVNLMGPFFALLVQLLIAYRSAPSVTAGKQSL